MKKYVLIAITCMSLSAFAMEEENQVQSHKTKQFAPHIKTTPFKNIMNDIWGSSLRKDEASPALEAVLLATIYNPNMIQSIR